MYLFLIPLKNYKTYMNYNKFALVQKLHMTLRAIK